MSVDTVDMNTRLMMDGNAAAGMLYDVFSREMTASECECASCGRIGDVGTLLAFMHGPGVILRCPACGNVCLRIARTREHLFLDARGSVYVRLSA